MQAFDIGGAALVSGAALRGAPPLGVDVGRGGVFGRGPSAGLSRACLSTSRVLPVAVSRSGQGAMMLSGTAPRSMRRCWRVSVSGYPPGHDASSGPVAAAYADADGRPAGFVCRDLGSAWAADQQHRADQGTVPGSAACPPKCLLTYQPSSPAALLKDVAGAALVVVGTCRTLWMEAGPA